MSLKAVHCPWGSAPLCQCGHVQMFHKEDILHSATSVFTFIYGKKVQQTLSQRKDLGTVATRDHLFSGFFYIQVTLHVHFLFKRWKLVLVSAALPFSSMLMPGFQPRGSVWLKACVMFQAGVWYYWRAVGAIQSHEELEIYFVLLALCQMMAGWAGDPKNHPRNCWRKDLNPYDITHSLKPP